MQNSTILWKHRGGKGLSQSGRIWVDMSERQNSSCSFIGQGRVHKQQIKGGS